MSHVFKISSYIIGILVPSDTALFHSSRDVHAIEKALSSDLEVVENWLGDNSLFLNKTKTECVLFGTAARLSSVTNFSNYVSGDFIKRVSEYKYLSVDALSWNDHVKYVLGKAGKRLGMLSQIRCDVTTNTANIIYKSFIIPVQYLTTVTRCGTAAERSILIS